MTPPAAIRDDFAGPGGWDEGLRMLGITDGVVGVEHDPWACATAEAAGHRRIRADVAKVASADWKGIDGYIASPPCPTFSLAGLGAGRNGIDLLAGAARALADGDDTVRERVVVELYLLIRRPLWRKQAATYRAALRGERRAKAKRPAKTKISQSALAMAHMSALVLEPVRAVRDLRPRWVALEQVPPVLPLWEAMADIFRGWGYNVSTGIVNAADVGVPQTRQRAFLVARSDGPAALPAPTHAKNPGGTLFPLPKWVSMAEALGWTDGAVRNQRGAGLLERHGPRRDHPVEEPAPTVRTGAGGGCGPNLIYVPALSDPPDMADGPAKTVCGSRQPRWVYGDADGHRGRNLGQSAEDDALSRTGTKHGGVLRTGANSMKHGRTYDDLEPYERSTDEPAPTIDRKVGGAWRVAPGPVLNPGVTDAQPNRRRRTADEPAPTVAFGHDAANWTWERPDVPVPELADAVEDLADDIEALAGDLAEQDPGHWSHSRPSTTIVGSFNPDVVAPPGWRTDPLAPRQDTPGAVRISPQQAAILQSFPADYPWQGNKTKVFEQIGNAVPPRMAAAVVGALLGLDWPTLVDTAQGPVR